MKENMIWLISCIRRSAANAFYLPCNGYCLNITPFKAIFNFRHFLFNEKYLAHTPRSWIYFWNYPSRLCPFLDCYKLRPKEGIIRASDWPCLPGGRRCPLLNAAVDLIHGDTMMVLMQRVKCKILGLILSYLIRPGGTSSCWSKIWQRICLPTMWTLNNRANWWHWKCRRKLQFWTYFRTQSFYVSPPKCRSYFISCDSTSRTTSSGHKHTI